MRDPKASDFCYYPFFQILLTPDGRYRPCSKHLDDITHHGKILDVTNATLEDAWNSEYMQRIRDDFHNNRKFPGCGECWRMQKMGLRSMRYHSYEYDISEEQVANPVAPQRIELNSSNVCNLRCRICGPRASTKWLPEGEKFYQIEDKVHYNMTPENLQQVKDWGPNLDEICFFGGEPLLSDENLKLIDYLIEKGYAPNIALLFNTNGTVFSDDLARKLGRFKKVRMSFSMDDIGKRFEYQRSGAKWDIVSNHLRQAYQWSRRPEWKNVELRICNTLSMFNAYYIPEIVNYFSEHFPGLRIFWNPIYDPWQFSIQILPKEIKDMIRERFRNEIKASFQFTEHETGTVQNLITYLDYEPPRCLPKRKLPGSFS